MVAEGVTGYVVDTAAEAAEAVARIADIDCGGCRTRARRRFGADRLVADYLRVYRALVAEAR